MSWNTLDQHIQDLARDALTDKQLQAWKLELAGLGTRRISQHLGISRSATTDRLNAAYLHLHRAGIEQDASGRYQLKELA